METESYDAKELYRLDDAIRSTMEAIRRTQPMSGFGGQPQQFGGGTQFGGMQGGPMFEQIADQIRERVAEGVRERVAEGVRRNLKHAVRERLAENLREQLGQTLRDELRQAFMPGGGGIESVPERVRERVARRCASGSAKRCAAPSPRANSGSS
jgi:hypothetical protein